MFKKTVRELHYSGGDAAFLDEAVKYLAINIYDKNKREHAGRVAIILTASANPRPLRATVKLLRKKDITTLTLALGPEASMTQVNDITKAKPDNRAYQLNSVSELPDNFMEVTDYLCTLGLEPETPKSPPAKPGMAKLSLGTTTTTQPPLLETIPTLTSTLSQHLPNPIQPTGMAPTTTSPSPSSLSSSSSPSSSPPSPSRLSWDRALASLRNFQFLQEGERKGEGARGTPSPPTSRGGSPSQHVHLFNWKGKMMSLSLPQNSHTKPLA